MEIDKFKKYIGEASPLELEAPDGTKDIFEIKPLPFENIADLLMIGKAFSKIPLDSPPEKFLELLDEDTINRMKKLVKETLKVSYPDLPDEVRDGFATKNFLPLVTKIFEINSMGGGKLEAVKEKIKRIRDKK